MTLAPIRREPDGEYVSRAGKPGYTTLSLDLPHIFAIRNSSGDVSSMQGAIQLAVRHVEYQIFFMFYNRFSDHISNDKNLNDIKVNIEMANVKYDGQVFSLSFNINVDEIENRKNISNYLIETFDNVFFSDENNLHSSYIHIFDEFRSLEYIYNIVSNGFIVISQFYINYIQGKIDIMLPIPPEKRELFADRLPFDGGGRENAGQFVERVWGDYVSANRLYERDIKKIDRPLYEALKKMSDMGNLSIYRYLRTIESGAVSRMSSCIDELHYISKNNDDINEELLRRLVDLQNKVSRYLTEGT